MYNLSCELLRRQLYKTNLPVIYMSFNSFEETEESHKEAPAGIAGYPETLPAIKPFSPSQAAYTMTKSKDLLLNMILDIFLFPHCVLW
jgi:hypothetical protein